MLDIIKMRSGENPTLEESIALDIEWFNTIFDRAMGGGGDFEGRTITLDRLREGLCIEIFENCVKETMRNPYNVYYRMQDSLCRSFRHDWYDSCYKDKQLELIVPLFQRYLCDRLIVCTNMDEVISILTIIEDLSYYQYYIAKEGSSVHLSLDAFNEIEKVISSVRLGNLEFPKFAVQYSTMIKPRFNLLPLFRNVKCIPVRLESAVSIFLQTLWDSLFTSVSKDNSEYIVKLWDRVKIELRLNSEYLDFRPLDTDIFYINGKPIAAEFYDHRDNKDEWDTRKAKEIVFSYYHFYVKPILTNRYPAFVVTFYRCTDGTYEHERFDTSNNSVTLASTSSDEIRYEWYRYTRGELPYSKKSHTLVAFNEKLLEYPSLKICTDFDVKWFNEQFDKAMNNEEFKGKKITLDSLREGLCVEIFENCVKYIVGNPYNVYFRIQNSLCRTICGYDWDNDKRKGTKLELIIPLFQRYLCDRLTVCTSMDEVTYILNNIENLAYYQCFSIKENRSTHLSLETFNGMEDVIMTIQLGVTSFLTFATKYSELIKPEFNLFSWFMTIDSTPTSLPNRVSLFLQTLWKSLFIVPSGIDPKYVLKLWSEVEVELKLCQEEYPNFIPLDTYMICGNDVPIAVAVSNLQDGKYKWDTRKDKKLFLYGAGVII